MKQANPKWRQRKDSNRSGKLIGEYEVTYCNTRKSWQIWHPLNGFIGAYRFKDRAIEVAKKLKEQK